MADTLSHLRWRLDVFKDRLDEPHRMILVLYANKYTVGQIAKALKLQPMKVKRSIEDSLSKIH